MASSDESTDISDQNHNLVNSPNSQPDTTVPTISDRIPHDDRHTNSFEFDDLLSEWLSGDSNNENDVVATDETPVVSHPLPPPVLSSSILPEPSEAAPPKVVVSQAEKAGERHEATCLDGLSVVGGEGGDGGENKAEIGGDDRREKDKSILKVNRRKTKEERFSFITESDVENLDDGYKWRKYGQKMVKNSPYPRSYYRCTQTGCGVKKHVERYAGNAAQVVTTYEGQHNHPSPLPSSPTHARRRNTTFFLSAISDDVDATATDDAALVPPNFNATGTSPHPHADAAYTHFDGCVDASNYGAGATSVGFELDGGGSINGFGFGGLYGGDGNGNEFGFGSEAAMQGNMEVQEEEQNNIIDLEGAGNRFFYNNFSPLLPISAASFVNLNNNSTQIMMNQVSHQSTTQAVLPPFPDHVNDNGVGAANFHLGRFCSTMAIPSTNPNEDFMIMDTGLLQDMFIKPVHKNNNN